MSKQDLIAIANSKGFEAEILPNGKVLVSDEHGNGLEVNNLKQLKKFMEY